LREVKESNELFVALSAESLRDIIHGAQRRSLKLVLRTEITGKQTLVARQVNKFHKLPGRLPTLKVLKSGDLRQ
jgi:hypothetical protein